MAKAPPRKPPAARKPSIRNAGLAELASIVVTAPAHDA